MTLDSKAAIDEATTAYEALTADQKALVTKLANLEEAEAKYQELKDAADKEETDKAAAKAVDEKITAIGEVTLGSKAAIDEARTAYEALTDDQQALVRNLSVLEAAESAYEELVNGNDDQTDDPDQTGDNEQFGTSGTQNNASDSGSDQQDDTSTPKTGGDFMLLWWIAVLVLALAGLIVFKRES